MDVLDAGTEEEFSTGSTSMTSGIKLGDSHAGLDPASSN